MTANREADCLAGRHKSTVNASGWRPTLVNKLSIPVRLSYPFGFQVVLADRTAYGDEKLETLSWGS